MRASRSSIQAICRAGGLALALGAAPAALAQESCDVALSIQPGLTFYDNTGATTDGPSPCGLLGADLWFRLDATAQGSFTISTCDQTFMDTVMAVYADCKTTAILCTDDSCGLQTTVSFAVTQGEDYYLQLGGWNGEQGSGAFNVEFRADGACCLPDSCLLTSEQACVAAGGIYRGDGTDCATAMCDQLGACCLPISQGLCQIMLEAECTSMGGTFNGAGTSCAGAAPLNGAALIFSEASASNVAVQDGGAFALSNSFTMEAWVRPSSTTGITRFLAKGNAGVPGSLGYGFGQNNGRLRFTSYGVLDYDTAGVYLTPGEWTHVAVIFDAFGSAVFFVNGQFVESITGFGGPNPSDLPFTIGSNAGGNLEFFDGVVDEVRFWNVERAFSDIGDNFDNTLNGDEAGLIGYWRLDEGKGTLADDLSPSGFDGFITNPQWIATQTCENIVFGACCLPSGQCISTNESGCTLAGGVFNGMGTTCGAAECPQPGACCLPVDQGLCRVLLPDDCAALGGSYQGAGTNCDNAGPFSGAALVLNGESDGVDNGNPVELQLSSGFTLESWVYPTSTTGIRRPIAKGQGGVAGYGFGLNGGRLRFTTYGIQDFDTAGTYVQPNRWSHIAVVYTNALNADFYVNGQYVETVTGFAPANPTDLSFFIGRNSAGAADAFVGRVDEIRVWNVERTATEIADNFDQPLSDDEPGLVGYWRLDEGAGTSVTNAVNGATGTFTGLPGWTATEACGGAPSCPADWNADDSVNSQDFFDFLGDFFTNNADFNNDNVTNSQDFFDFLAAFFTPC